jgi:hypothetical protein
MVININRPGQINARDTKYNCVNIWIEFSNEENNRVRFSVSNTSNRNDTYVLISPCQSKEENKKGTFLSLSLALSAEVTFDGLGSRFVPRDVSDESEADPVIARKPFGKLSSTVYTNCIMFMVDRFHIKFSSLFDSCCGSISTSESEEKYFDLQIFSSF